ncbi:MAG: SDR family oxidoreductase [Labilithrix sp.]|nr:SDR family oxidoreductase [Labilithrix sp.]MBX3223948.1 SDR family oxidoreductase [Labilithrix sp.]
MKGLDGKVALVTGGGKGIGRSIALALAARGVRIVVTGRDEKALGETVGEIAYGGGKARHLAGDVRDAAHLSAAVERAVEVFGGLDIVIANAGQSGRVELGGDDLARAEAIVSTNLMGAYYTFNAAAKRMKGPGRLVATSSVLAKFGVSGYAAYCASKAGILGLVRATAEELGPRKITCNAVVPGWVDTAMSDDGIREIAASQGTTEEAAKAAAVAAFPLGRFLEPEEVAELVVFLCSSAGEGITGQAISICGGATAFGG